MSRAEAPGRRGAPRVVVIGNGMAGSRLVEEIRVRDPRRRLSITVFGAEVHAAYNRVLLSEVLAGRHTVDEIRLAGPAWAAELGIDLRLGSRVVEVDRERRRVRADDGTATAYDLLVLATGSRAVVPELAGLRRADGSLLPGAFVFRTVDDCREIVAAASAARRAVVLGGGLLGLEAARGLAGRRLDTVLVHRSGHLMERQLDPPAGRTLAGTLARLGVRVRLDARAVGVAPDGDGSVGALLLDDGGRVPTDLLVIATGVRPDVALARSAGLRVDAGVVVDDTLRSVTDPRVFAVGECASHDGQVYGLVAPAWEQAGVVGAHVTGADPTARYRGSRQVTRLKAADIGVAAMGETRADDDDPAAEVLQFSDRSRGTYKKLVLRDDRLVGAILVGDLSTVGTVTQLYERGAGVPVDRVPLLFPVRRGRDGEPAPGGTPSPGGTGAGLPTPAALPPGATVCRCNGVSKGRIQDCVLAGARTVDAVARATRATTGCGGCRELVGGLVDALAADPVAPADPVTSRSASS